VPWIVNAVAVGLLSNIVRKLGPSIVLFAYLWAHHSKFVTRLDGSFMGLPVNAWLAAAAILLGVLSLAFKDSVGRLSKFVDRRANPELIGWVLHHIHKGDLTAMNIQRCSTDILLGLKSAAVFALLIAIAAISFPVFAGVLIAVVVIMVVLSLQAARQDPARATASFLGRMRSHPEYYAEILVIAGLVLAFMAIAGENSFVSGTVFVLIVSRYSGDMKVLARMIVAVRRSHLAAKLQRQRRAERETQRLAREANAEALRQQRAKAAEEKRQAQLALAESRRKALEAEKASSDSQIPKISAA